MSSGSSSTDGCPSAPPESGCGYFKKPLGSTSHVYQVLPIFKNTKLPTCSIWKLAISKTNHSNWFFNSSIQLPFTFTFLTCLQFVNKITVQIVQFTSITLTQVGSTLLESTIRSCCLSFKTKRCCC